MAEQCKISAAMVSESEERSYARSYVLKVDGYSRAKAMLKNGECMTSAPFSVGGRDWVVECYPNGCNKNFSDYISLYLHLKSTDAEDVKVLFTVSLLDTNGEPVPSHNPALSVNTFSSEYPYYGYYMFIKKAHLEASAHLKHDCFTMRWDLTVMKEILGEEETRASPSDLHKHLGDLLKNKEAADLTFQVGGQSFSAHRCVLAARSSVFKAELLGAMKEGSAASPIEICDMEPDVFNSLLRFIYTDSVPPVLDVVIAGHLLVAAERYKIGRLKQICEEKLCNNIDSNMVATSLALAEQHGFHRLKEACLQFLDSPSNFKAMMASDGYEHLKSSCSSVLRELIARILPAEWEVARDVVMTM